MAEHQAIWLQPWCAGCDKHCSEGRLWCQDNVWEPCEKCGAKPVRYIIDRRQSVAPQKGDRA